MRSLCRSFLLLATLLLWLPSAGAFCVSEVAYDYVMRGDEPTPAQSLPCCSAAADVTAAAPKSFFPGGSGAVACCGATPDFPEFRVTPLLGAGSPLPWRSYSERSARLLQ
jgi:hypothetical protein